ncbi:MAG: class I SAM-dependent methyltransferase, partial [Pseudomonadota bacterium]
MQPDVRQIQNFYASALGQTVAEIVRGRLRTLLTDHRGDGTRPAPRSWWGAAVGLGAQGATSVLGPRGAAKLGGFITADTAGRPRADSGRGVPGLGGASQFKPSRWQPIPGDAQIAIGIGYATPYLRLFDEERFDRVLSFMPRAQGVTMWPAERPYRSALVDPNDLPLPNACADVMLAVHHLEMADHPYRALREIWRVLRPEGCLIILVPNRTGLWAPTDRTPFGHGRPYSIGQMTSLMRDTLLEPEYTRTVLNAPPVLARRARGLAKGLEK